MSTRRHLLVCHFTALQDIRVSRASGGTPSGAYGPLSPMTTVSSGRVFAMCRDADQTSSISWLVLKGEVKVDQG